jgi:hypothetical protein
VTVTSKDGVYAGPTPILVKITADGAGSEYKGWDIGTADYSGKVRGTAGAIYTLTYRVTDLAGNTTTCKATIQTARY